MARNNGKKKIVACVLLFWSLALQAATIIQTKNQLQLLNHQISKLQQRISTAHDRRSELNQELMGAEKQISKGIRKLRSLQSNRLAKQNKIKQLQQEIESLEQKLGSQQRLLAQHLTAMYKMGQYTPVKWLLNQDDPQSISRLLTFYQYLIKSRQEIITKIDGTKKQISLNKEQLNLELTKELALAKQLQTHQSSLEESKERNRNILQSLERTLQTQQQSLVEFKRNKQNLSQILQNLAAESPSPVHLPFVQMRHKLPQPVKVPRKSMRAMNQGLTFFTEEGAIVSAVYPGKVVFSDWLNGYGLLLIIDHGKGFMTLYAHNQSLFKRKGTMVLQGESIASVGHSGGIKQNGLYFEVRQYGKAVSPSEWLA